MSFRFKPYRWLWSGVVVNALGNGIAPVALAFAVLDLGGSATDLGIVIGLYALADVAAVLFGGVLGDRLPRTVVMVASTGIAALSQGLVAASLLGGWSSLTLLALLGMVNGALSALGNPSSSAITKQTVPAAVLRSAISMRRIGQNVAQIVGAGSAGILVAVIGSGAALAIDAVTFALAALCFSRIRVAALPKTERTGMFAEVRDGWREVLRHSWLWLLIGQALLYHLFYGGAQGVLGPIVAGAEFGRPAWGWALSVQMAGFVVGGLVTLRWKPRRALFTGTVFLLLTACFPAALAFSHVLPFVLVGAFLHGFGLEIFSVGWDLSIQENVAPDKLSRVYAFDLVGSFVARPIGLALTGPVATAVGFRAWFAVVALVIAASTLAALLSPDVRHLKRHADTVPDHDDAAEGSPAQVPAGHA
jgi:MFS family permease